MAVIRINQFRGIVPAVSSKLLNPEYATIAHNALLRDGKLRPYAKWQKVANYNSSYKSLVNNPVIGNMGFSAYEDAVRVDGPPFANKGVLGISNNVVNLRNEVLSNTDYAGVHGPTLLITTSTDPQGDSSRPVARAYAYTFKRYTGLGYEEGPLTVITGAASTEVIYEGDIVNFTTTLDLVYPNFSICIYRAITELSDANALNASLNTEWHLVGEVPLSAITSGEVFFSDGGSPVTDPLDVNLSSRFYPPPENVSHFGLTDGGWFVAASNDGQLLVSEKFLSHAWPIEHRYAIPYQIVDVAIYYDNVYIGTNGPPFMVALRDGQAAGVEGQMMPFPEAYPCLPGSMDKTATGAVYCAQEGVIALDPGGQKLITRGLANSGDTLYRVGYEVDDSYRERNLQFKDVIYGFTYKGQYFGVMAYTSQPEGEGGDVQSSAKTAFVLDMRDPINGERMFQQLVTMDVPDGRVLDNAVGPQGLYILHTTGTYVLPLPDNRTNIPYERADKLCYKWRSKEFHFDSEIALAAARVEMRGKPIRMRIIVGCNCVYETEVCNSKPFTIPNQVIGRGFFIELEGTAEVDEIALATSLRELAQ